MTDDVKGWRELSGNQGTSPSLTAKGATQLADVVPETHSHAKDTMMEEKYATLEKSLQFHKEQADRLRSANNHLEAKILSLQKDVIADFCNDEHGLYLVRTRDTSNST